MAQNEKILPHDEYNYLNLVKKIIETGMYSKYIYIFNIYTKLRLIFRIKPKHIFQFIKIKYLLQVINGLTGLM